jgi:crotonobetainyl-CoA:carnitine CoA-transferase CaiB-like acyl-CoA transferase
VLGEDTDRVLRERLGLDEREIEDLRTKGAIA